MISFCNIPSNRNDGSYSISSFNVFKINFPFIAQYDNFNSNPNSLQGFTFLCKPSGFIRCFHMFDGSHSTRDVAEFMVVLTCIPMMVGTVSSF